jgi:thioredoxin-related protein
MKVKLILVATMAIAMVITMCSFSGEKDNHGLIKWVSFGEAVELCKKEPRMIMIDIYTTWCGPCKMLSANTFGNQKIADYMNRNFYCVRFDAETRDTLRFFMDLPDTVRSSTGAIKKIDKKKQQYSYTNVGGGQRGTHQFAVSILEGFRIAYPSMVFLSKNIQRVDVVQGYLDPKQFEPVMKFYGSGYWEKGSYQDFQRTFVSEF